MTTRFIKDMTKTARKNDDSSLLHSWEQDFYAYVDGTEEFKECKKKLEKLISDPSWQRVLMETPTIRLHFINEWLKYTYSE